MVPEGPIVDRIESEFAEAIVLGLFEIEFEPPSRYSGRLLIESKLPVLSLDCVSP